MPVTYKKSLLLKSFFILLGIWAILWLFLGYSSPASKLLTKPIIKIIQSNLKHKNMLFHCERSGLSLFLNKLYLSKLKLIESEKNYLQVDSIVVSPRITHLLFGQLSLRSLKISGIRSKATVIISPQPNKQAEVKPFNFNRIDLKKLPEISITNVFIELIINSTNFSDLKLTITNTLFLSSYSRRHDKRIPPYQIMVSSYLNINNGSNILINTKCEIGKLLPDNIKMANFDVSLSARQINLTDFNPLFYYSAPFFVKNGQMEVETDLRARNNILAGLCSIKIENMDIIENNYHKNSTFLCLSFNAWKFLIRNRKGDILIDCEVDGTVDKPNIPLGTTLLNTIETMGYSTATRLLNAIPTATTREVADKIEANTVARSKYNDLLKINRLDKREQHLARGQHWEKIVKNYPEALKEYSLQVQNYPMETNYAVQALMASAEVKRKYMQDYDDAINTLRQVLTDYKNSNQADDALYKMIQISLESKNYHIANNFCDEFIKTFPTSEFIPKIKQIKKEISRFVW